MTWTQAEAIALCILIEDVSPAFGCHVALTGGLLYKHGYRKDCDIVLYRIREVSDIDVAGLFTALAGIGIDLDKPLDEIPRFVVKAKWRGRPIDFLFPEGEGDSGDYWMRSTATADAKAEEIPL